MLTVWQRPRVSAVKLSVSPSREQLERIMAITDNPGQSLWQMVRWSDGQPHPQPHQARVTGDAGGQGHEPVLQSTILFSGKLHNNDKWPQDKPPYRHHIIQQTLT